jgi:hypothetical protein
MAEKRSDKTDRLSSSTVSITVLSVKPVKFGKIFALASVEIGHRWRAARHPWGSRQSGSAKGHPDRFTHVPR